MIRDNAQRGGINLDTINIAIDGSNTKLTSGLEYLNDNSQEYNSTADYSIVCELRLNVDKSELDNAMRR